jgi:hypothetical protein
MLEHHGESTPKNWSEAYKKTRCHGGAPRTSSDHRDEAPPLRLLLASTDHLDFARRGPISSTCTAAAPRSSSSSPPCVAAADGGRPATRARGEAWWSILSFNHRDWRPLSSSTLAVVARFLFHENATRRGARRLFLRARMPDPTHP